MKRPAEPIAAGAGAAAVSFSPHPADDWPRGGMPEEFVRYGLAIQPVFTAFRNVASQLGGALILYAVSTKDRVELASLEAAGQRFEEGVAMLRAIKPPACANRHAVLLGAIAAELKAVFISLPDLFRRPVELEAITAPLERLQGVRARLLKASDHRLGMMVVDFRYGCCGCGAAGPQPPNGDQGGA